MPLFSKAAKKVGIWFGCYPNVSEKREDGSWNLRASSNKQMAACALDWMKAGAALVGSCCHSTPRTSGLIRTARDHYYLLKEEVDIDDIAPEESAEYWDI